MKIDSVEQQSSSQYSKMSLKAYIQIARPDHWFKNVFMVPGMILGIFDNQQLLDWNLVPRISLALLSVCLLASSNYVINEIIDGPKDSHHPVKKHRPIPSGKIRLSLAYLEWMFLGTLGLILAFFLGWGFFSSACLLIIMGLAYNIPPVRLKDIAYLDVLSESVNNPIRLLLGWYSVGNTNVIMASLVLSYWMLGAFFMAVKRYAEYKYINEKKTAAYYRKSFAYYNSGRLLTSIIFYAAAFGLFSGVFIARYHLELILSVPFVAGFISYYLHLGFRDNSPVQYPESLYRIKPFVFYTACCFFIIVTLLFINIPMLVEFFDAQKS